MGQQASIKYLPLKMPFQQGLLYIETDKHVYYPGQAIHGNIHLLVNDAITDAKCLDIKVEGRESFKFTTFKKRDEESCRNYF